LVGCVVTFKQLAVFGCFAFIVCGIMLKYEFFVIAPLSLKGLSLFSSKQVILFQSEKWGVLFRLVWRKGGGLKKMQRKNVAKIAVVAGLLFMLTYALAAELGLETGFVGSSTADVSGSYNVKIKSVVDRTTTDKMFTVSSVELKADKALPAGTEIYVNVLDATDVVIGTGQITLTSEVPKNGKITVTITPVSGSTIVAPAAVGSYQVSIVTSVSDFP